MEFLKAILGDALFAQVEKAVNDYNGADANKDKQIKIANLATGEYVGKGKFDALQAQFDGKGKELDSANALIAELKKGTKDNESLQTKISGYEAQVATLQAELLQTKIDNAIKVSLLESKAVDTDYLAFKLKTKGENIELDEQGKIKGWSDKLAGLKTQFPTMFEGSAGKKFDPNKLPDDDGKDGANVPHSLAEALKMADEANDN